MAIKNIIARGIGFSAANIKWIVTHGFSISTAVDYATPTKRVHVINQDDRIHAINGDDRNHVIEKNNRTHVINC